MLFSTLRFLRMVDQRVARRQRLKEWLLLMARLLLVAAVVGALYHRTVGGMDGGRAQVAVAIVLDDSCSMRTVRDGATRFAHMRKAAGAVLAGLQSGDSACLLLAGAPGDEPPRMTSDVAGLRIALGEMECGFGAAGIMPALRRAAETLAATQAERRELYVISDMQQTAWPEAAPTDDAADTTFADMDVFLVDVAGAGSPNLGIGRAEFDLNVQTAGVASSLLCSLVSASDEDQRVDVEFHVGGDKVAVRPALVAGGDEQSQRFTFRFDRTGQFACAVQIGPDGLDADNLRHVVVDVRDISVLIVNGRPSPVHYMNETFYVERALRARTAAAGEQAPLEVSVVRADELDGRMLDEFACVILANVGELRDVDALRSYVNGGGGLIIFSGDLIDPTACNTLLGVGKEGLLPAPLDRVRDRSENPGNEPFAIRRLAWEHPVFRSLTGRVQTGGARVFRHFDVGENEAYVLAELDSGRPLLLEKQLGDGVVLLCTTSADMDWANLPTQVSLFVPVVHQMVYHAARSLRRATDLHVGAGLHVPSDDGAVVAWHLPGEKDAPNETDLDRDDPNLLKTTHRPGIYRAELADGERLFAVNVDPAESSPRRVADDEAGMLLGAPDAVLVRRIEKLGGVAVRRREGLPLWDYLLALAILIAVVEGFIGNRLLPK